MAPSAASWLLLPTVVCLLIHTTQAYFCSRFFLDIKDRSPLAFTVNDSTPVGAVLHQFDSGQTRGAPGSPVASFPGNQGSRQAITFTSGDLKFINYDPEDNALKVMAPLYSQIDKTLTIYGTCVDFISLIAYEINIPVSMTLSVVDTNDPPVFRNLPATYTIPEGTPPGLLNFTVDIDNSFDKRPEFIRTDLMITSVTSDANHIGEPPFRLRDDGAIELLYTMDYETGPRAYNVTFTAQDYGRPPMANSSVLRVIVGDLDDTAPAFNRAKYEVQVTGEKPITDKVCFSTSPPIHARDQDEGLNTPVRYEITRGEPEDWEDYFSLEGGTGQLCQLATMPRNALHPGTHRNAFTNYTFTIRASQVDNSAMYDTGQLWVHVRDANEHAPMFERALYRETVPEAPRTRDGARILQVQATDMDHGLNSVFEYSLSPEAYPAFVVDPHSGWITLHNQTWLDRELSDVIEFRAFARETQSLEPRLDECRVVVVIEDINDNRPRFHSRSYTYTIRDTLRPGLALHQADKGAASRPVTATDADQGDNGRLQYRIRNVWRRGGSTSLTDLGRFTIDPDEGTLRLAGTLNDLRRQKEHPTYKLKVIATDRAREKDQRKSAHTYAIVNVEGANEHAPRFDGERGDIWLNESVPLGTIITDLEVTDDDGDEDVYLTYDVTHGNQDGQFDFINGGRLVLAKPLDRERQDDYSLTVRVSDGLHTVDIPVGVHVTDVNDNAPQFTAETYMFHILEEPEVGTVLGRVSAYDRDLGEGGRVRYDLLGDLANTIFMMEQDGSLIVRTRSASLDAEQSQQVRFRVMASDHGLPSRNSTVEITLVLEDRNDNPPIFPYSVYYGWVEEDNMRPKPQVVRLETSLNATDADVTPENRDIRYFLSGEGSDTFELDPARGDLVVRRPGGLDCESMAEYSLQVKAVDHAGSGLSADTTLIIQVRDENDHGPEFQNPAIFRTSPDIKTNAIIGKITAKDDDVTKPNNEVIYLLKTGGYGKFGVDYRSGDIYLADDLGREPVMAEYELQIEALDGGIPRRAQQALISIQVPYQLPPRILANTTHIRVEENQPALTTVGRLVARDGQGRQDNLVFFTKEIDVPFVVTKQGDVRTRRALDREMAPVYEFDVYVSDGGQPAMTSSARVTVTIDDVNDSAPTFTLHRYEGHITEDNRDPKPGQAVRMSANIGVVDVDHGGTRHVRFTVQGDARTLFNIDTRTGALRVSERAAGQIDREKREFFELKLVATDQNGYGLSSQADLTIYIDDVNDEVPEFTNRGAQFFVDEDVETGRPIGKLSATDPDATEPNNKIIYLLEGDSIGKFSVEPYSGAIIPLKGLFYQPRYQIYVLRVAAMDLGHPNKKTTDRVHVRMRKQIFNDHRPEFRSRTVFTVKEEVPLGTLVGTIQAVDLDVGPGQGLTLDIVDQRPAVPFKIHSVSGELRTTARLDADDSGEPMYSFVVRAKDHGDPPLEALAHVSVIVEDVNDNPPVFTQPMYHHYASSLYPPGTAVATPFAHDDVDSGDSTYRYALKGEGAGIYFTINPTTGIVQTTAHLVHINVTQVRFDVFAQDIFNSRLFAHALLIVDILQLKNEVTCPCT